jgi:predicted nucleic acid-binding protein
MKQKIYLETTVPSVLTARLSNNLILAGEQELTREWWESRRGNFEILVSELVVEECQKGDADAAARRLAIISGLDILQIDEEVIRLTDSIIESGIIPHKAAADAAHIALASRHGVDYLLTWNCRHIANAEINKRIAAVVRQTGYELPVICTPTELFGGQDED